MQRSFFLASRSRISTLTSNYHVLLINVIHSIISINNLITLCFYDAFQEIQDEYRSLLHKHLHMYFTIPC